MIGGCHRASDVVTPDHVGSRCREWPFESSDYALTSRRVAKSWPLAALVLWEQGR